MTTTDVRSYLEGKGLTLKRAGADEMHTSCVFCSEDPSKRGRLYVNVDPSASIPGLFHCKLCDARGALPSLMRHFGDQPEKGDVEDDRALIRREILERAAAFYHEQLADHPDAYAWLKGPERGLTLETIVERQLGYAPASPPNVLYRHLRDCGYSNADIQGSGMCTVGEGGRTVDSLRGTVTIPYFVAGNVVQIRGRTWPWDKTGDVEKYKTPIGGKVRLYNSDAFWGTDGADIIVTEGEFDALVLHQLGFENVVGLPGANVWQDTWDGYVTDVRRIYVVMDNDDAGNKALNRLKERHGAKVRVVELADNTGAKVDPTSWVAAGGTSVEFSRVMRHSGNSLLLTVDEAFCEWLEVQSQVGIRFGVEMLDNMLHPGLLPGQVVVILAKSGTGKTLFLLNLMQRMVQVHDQQDMKFLFLSLEQTRGEWFERARRIHRFYNLDGGDEQSTLSFWRDRLMLVDKNRLTEAEIRVILDDFEDRMGQLPDIIFLDYLGYFAQSYKGDRYERVSDAIMGLKGLGKDLRVPVVCPHQVSRIAKYGEEPDTDAARDAGVVEETADFLLTLWTQDHILGRQEEQKSGVVNCRIGKSRHGGRGTKVSFQFAPVSLSLVPFGDKLVDRARQELKYQALGDRFDAVVLRHRGELPAGEFAQSKDLVRLLDSGTQRRLEVVR